jgi:Na+/H+ antiporter NhaD/arsenite permease-like protein
MWEKWFVLAVFTLVFVLILYRKIPIFYLSLGAAAVLIIAGIVPLGKAFKESINWDVLAIYFGYGMLAVALRESNLPKAIADWVLPRLHKEKYALLFLCSLSAFLSSFMANPVVVLMLAPLAIEIAVRLKANLFLYLVGLAISSNVVTTVSMVADPPALILAMQTNMGFLDFYWFQGRPGLGTLSVVGVVVALLTLLLQFRKLNHKADIKVKAVRTSLVSRILLAASILAAGLVLVLKATGYNLTALLLLGVFGVVITLTGDLFDKNQGKETDPHLTLTLSASGLFLLSVIALSIVPANSLLFPWLPLKYQGLIGLILGVLALFQVKRIWKNSIFEFDWQSILFLVGIFIVVASVDEVGLLKDFAAFLTGMGLINPLVIFIIITWLSVVLSSFIDNVPYTVLMIPVCSYLAQKLGVNPYFFYFGMLVGTGIGGNITPVGATANVLACGMLEKRGHKIELAKFLKISIPFSCAAVLAVQILLQIFWMG